MKSSSIINLKRTQFGDPILHQKAAPLSIEKIKSSEIKTLVAAMKTMLHSQKFGVGIAAPQVGYSFSFSVISIRPTPARADKDVFEAIIFNPVYKGVGRKVPKWEGCLSFGTKNSPVFAQAMRYEEVEARYLDENGIAQKCKLKGLAAHVFQHETDHLNGILFPERVVDHRSWMNAREYKKRVVVPSRQALLRSDTIG